MKDVYLYDDIPVLKNLLNIKDKDLLEQAESDITYVKLLYVDDVITGKTFDYNRLKAIHKYIFEDIYEWAGEERTIFMVKGERVLGGDTVRYSYPADIKKNISIVLSKINAINWNSLSIEETADKFSVLIANLWQVHPFREGNTRAVITFAAQFAEAHGFKMNKALLKDNSDYVRDALVKASDGIYSDYKYLRKIIKNAIEIG